MHQVKFWICYFQSIEEVLRGVKILRFINQRYQEGVEIPKTCFSLTSIRSSSWTKNIHHKINKTLLFCHEFPALNLFDLTSCLDCRALYNNTIYWWMIYRSWIMYLLVNCVVNGSPFLCYLHKKCLFFPIFFGLDFNKENFKVIINFFTKG